MGMPHARHRVTVDEYHRMGEAGIFGEDDRVELIDGQILEMTPIGVAHASCVNRLTELFAPVAGSRATLSVQNPVILTEHEEPQPDVMLLRYRVDGYATRHPGPADVLLLVEVADRSLTRDREEKLPSYATTGIAEMWLVNLPGGGIEVCREPHDGRYTAVRTVRRGDTITPLAFPDLALRVDAILA
jgi:Uma2 family endonuclease